VDLEEEFEQLAVVDLRRVEDDLDRLGVISMIAIGLAGHVAAGIADARRDHARSAPDQILHPPAAGRLLPCEEAVDEVVGLIGKLKSGPVMFVTMALHDDGVELGLAGPNMAAAAPVEADGCPELAGGSMCMTLGNKYDLSDLDASIGRKARIQGSPREGPESAR
jgi:hypothetical protein